MMQDNAYDYLFFQIQILLFQKAKTQPIYKIHEMQKWKHLQLHELHQA